MNNFIKYSMLCITTCVSLLVVYRYTAPDKQHQNSFPPNVESDKNLSHLISIYRERVKELETTNALLLKQTFTCQNLKKLTVDAIPKIDQEQQSTDIAQDALEEYHQANKNADAFLNYFSSLNNPNGPDLDKDLAEKFNAEPVDYAWANDYEIRISKIFLDNKELAHFVPEKIQCKTKKCQIKIPLANMNEANKLAENFSAALNSNTAGVNKTALVSTTDIESGHINLYITKNNSVQIYQ